MSRSKNIMRQCRMIYNCYHFDVFVPTISSFLLFGLVFSCLLF